MLIGQQGITVAVFSGGYVELSSSCSVPTVLLEELRERDPVRPKARLAKVIDEVVDTSSLRRPPCHKRCVEIRSDSESEVPSKPTVLLHLQFRLGEQWLYCT